MLGVVAPKYIVYYNIAVAVKSSESEYEMAFSRRPPESADEIIAAAEQKAQELADVLKPLIDKGLFSPVGSNVRKKHKGVRYSVITTSKDVLVNLWFCGFAPRVPDKLRAMGYAVTLGKNGDRDSCRMFVKKRRS